MKSPKPYGVAEKTASYHRPSGKGRESAAFAIYSPDAGALIHLTEKARQGVPAAAFFDFVSESNTSRSDMADLLQVSVKTLTRYRAEKKKLTPSASELLLKWSGLYQKGIELFGSVDAFNRWLRKESFGLGGLVPFHLMNTASGSDLIMEELLRIEFGDLA